MDDDDSSGPSVVPKLALDDISLIRVLVSIGAVMLFSLLLAVGAAIKIILLIRNQISGDQNKS